MKGRCPKCSYGFEFEAADTVTCPSCGATMRLRAKAPGAGSGSGDARAGAGASTPPPLSHATPPPRPDRAPTPAPAKRAEPVEDEYADPPRATPAKRPVPPDEETYAPPRVAPPRRAPPDDEPLYRGGETPPRTPPAEGSPPARSTPARRTSSRDEDGGGRDAGGGKASGPALPETMRANKVVAGRACPGCDRTIALGTDVHNCPACGSSHHAGCWDAAAGCAASACAVKAAEAAVDERPAGARRARKPTSEIAGSTKPCKFCGEQILSDVKKCRYCGEYQTAGERAMAQARQGASDPDGAMGGAEWALAILCSGIGCIVGIVWCIQGKKKGPKMVLVSICVQVFWGLVRGCIEMSQHNRY